MFKKYIYIFLISCLLILTLLQLLSKNKSQKSVLSTTSLTPTPTPLIVPNGIHLKINFQKMKYSIFVVKVKSTDKISLIPNFKENMLAGDIVASNSCKIAINGGFYTTTNTPLGLFIANKKILGKQVKSLLVNGFFWQEKNNIRSIAKLLPVNYKDFDFILQTGPFMQVAAQKIKLINDENARRSLIGIDQDNNIYLIAIVNSDNHYDGPLLSDVPLIFSLPSVQTYLPLTYLINLDGGSASFFFSKDNKNEFILSSLSPVGSIICIR